MTPLLFDIGKDQSAALADLHAGAFAEPWSGAAIADLLATPGAFAFHLQEGFVLARVAGDEAEILTLAVDPKARGRGLGRALLQAAMRHAVILGAEAMFLEVGIDNPAALALYSGLGFVRTGHRKGYYPARHSAGQDALIMKLPLPPLKDFA